MAIYEKPYLVETLLVTYQGAKVITFTHYNADSVVNWPMTWPMTSQWFQFQSGDNNAGYIVENNTI